MSIKEIYEKILKVDGLPPREIHEHILNGLETHITVFEELTHIYKRHADGSELTIEEKQDVAVHVIFLSVANKALLHAMGQTLDPDKNGKQPGNKQH